MAYEKDGPPFTTTDFAHLAQTFLLEFSIPHSQYLIHNQDLTLQVCSYGKRQADVHPTTVSLYRSIDILLYSAECDNLVKSGGDFFFPHPQDGPIQEYIFSTSEFWMEPGTNLK